MSRIPTPSLASTPTLRRRLPRHGGLVCLFTLALVAAGCGQKDAPPKADPPSAKPTPDKPTPDKPTADKPDTGQSTAEKPDAGTSGTGEAAVAGTDGTDAADSTDSTRTGDSAETDGTDSVKKPAGPPSAKPPSAPQGLQFQLDDADAEKAAGGRLPAAKASPLDEAATQTLLKRLTPLETEAGDKPAFAFRKRSLPAPRTGQTITTQFPPENPGGAAPAVEKGPLKVRRFSPEGDVPLAPKLSVTFSQPMVAVTSHAELEKLPSPVTLSPTIEGRWRWVGTQNLVFESTGRLPMATVFTATVPAGTTSATGGKLAEAVSWNFQTPPPRLLTKRPSTSEPQPLEPVIVLGFDQRIDADTVRKRLIVTAGGKAITVRAATADEIAADRVAKAITPGLNPGTWLAIRPTKALPRDASIEVTVPKGTPSAEGPRKTESAQSFSFRTYSPLIVKEVKCGWRGQCAPLQAWSVRFNNPINPEVFEKGWITTDPPIDGFEPMPTLSASMTLRGRTKGRTKYKVHLSKHITDIFGQTLGKDVSWDIYVGDARPWFSVPGGSFTVLDPAVKTADYPVYTINHESVKVRLYAVTPDDYDTFRVYARRAGDLKDRPAAPGKLVHEATVSIDGKADELTETRIDLRPALKSGKGQLVLEVEPTKQSNKWRRQVSVVWIQRTDIAVDAFHDGETLNAFVTRLDDGKPVAGCTVRLSGEAGTVTTDATGLAAMPLPSAKDGHRVLVASLGDDLALLPENNYHWSSGGTWLKRDVSESLRWFVFDDRNLYKPKETVRFKGWIRRVTGGKAPSIDALAGGASAVTWKVTDPRGNEIAKGQASLNDFGGFHGEFTLPDNANLGWATVHLNATGGSVMNGRSMSHRFQIQEFKRPEFEVKTEVSDGPHFVGGEAQMSLTASYFAGGGLANTDVNWNVTATLTNFTPPNWREFAFGVWSPWWYGGGGNGASTYRNYKGVTDGQGTHRLGLKFESVDPPRPTQITARGTVVDVNRRTWTSTGALLVHPADLYVGLKSERAFVEAGKELPVQLVVVDLDGKAVAGKAITMETVRLEWTSKKGVWTEERRDEQTCNVTSGAEPVDCTIKTTQGGTYVSTVTVTDDKGRKNMTERRFWVTGGKRPQAKKVEQEDITLIPDKETYEPGDVAEIMVQSPFSPGSGRLMVKASGFLQEEGFELTGPTHTLKIPITEDHYPTVQVQVYVAGSAIRPGAEGDPDPSLPRRPAFAYGSLTLKVPPLKRTLTAVVTPTDDELAPGGETDVTVVVTDADGKPVSDAEVAIVVVDEAVLALNGYRIPDPVSLFYRPRPELGGRRLLRSSVLLAELDNLDFSSAPGDGNDKMARMATASPKPSAPPAEEPMAAEPELEESMDDEGGGGDDDGGGAIKVRKNFDPLALFQPELPTDAKGRATVRVKLPDNLTRYRLTAVVVEKARRYGYGESSITARLPLMVRPSAPRFLNFGDTFELPIVLQNQTREAMTVQIAVRASGIGFTEGQGRTLTIPASDRVEVRFPAAVEHVGTGRIQIAAAAGKWADAANVSLPIWTPATTEAFATYGTIDKGAIVQPVKAPPEVVPQFGGLEVTTSSTALQALTDAVLYLVAYPYECSEQLSSRVLAVAALKDVLTAFEAEGLPSPEEMLAAVDRDIKRLERLQRYDGGFSFWRPGDPGWPYLSVHVAHALVRAQGKGFEVPKRMMDRSKSYLQDIDRHFPSWYPERVRWTIASYAVNVRHMMGDSDPARARQLIKNFGGADKTSLEALGWLLPVLSKDPASTELVGKIRRHIDNRVTETAGNAHFVTSYGDGAYLLLHSDRRVDGIVLEALIQDQPDSDVIPKVVRGLLAHRKRGRWGNTQENAFVLLALDRYFNTYEKETPDFVARVWLGKGYAGDHKFKGRTTERHQIDIPMAELLKTDGQQPLTVQKDGAGRLYYRVGMRYAPRDLKVPAANHGFVVERIYEGVDDADDVTRREDGTWIVKAGARVRVRVTMVAEARRYHVALVDPLPAGLEPLNTALRGTEPVPSDPGYQGGSGGSRSPWSYRWWGPWYEHQNLRDERAEAFTSLLWDGVYTYSYIAQAITPGEFVVPPAKAEEMYAPETFGRSAGDRVIVTSP